MATCGNLFRMRTLADFTAQCCKSTVNQAKVLKKWKLSTISLHFLRVAVNYFIIRFSASIFKLYYDLEKWSPTFFQSNQKGTCNRYLFERLFDFCFSLFRCFCDAIVSNPSPTVDDMAMPRWAPVVQLLGLDGRMPKEQQLDESRMRQSLWSLFLAFDSLPIIFFFSIWFFAYGWRSSVMFFF